MQVLRGARCRIKGWCRVIYVDAWRCKLGGGGQRKSRKQLPILVLNDEWAGTHGVMLRPVVTSVRRDDETGRPVAELASLALGQRCRVPGTDQPIDRHAAAAVLALLLHTIGT